MMQAEPDYAKGLKIRNPTKLAEKNSAGMYAKSEQKRVQLANGFYKEGMGEYFPSNSNKSAIV